MSDYGDDDDGGYVEQIQEAYEEYEVIQSPTAIPRRSLVHVVTGKRKGRGRGQWKSF